MKWIVMPLITLTALLTLAARVPAQSVSIYGSIVGSVVDASGAAVPGLKVTTTNVETGLSNSALSSSFGYYRIDGLIAGAYKIEAEGPGFKKYIKDRISLASAQ